MLKKIRNLFGDKSIKLAAVLALGSISQNANALVKNNIDNKIKTEEVINNDSDSTKLNKDKTYSLTKDDAARMINNKENSAEIKIDFNIDYKTDKADLDEKHQELIVEQFTKFLTSINQNNFDTVSESTWQVFSSCDERETDAWGKEGNKALAEARGEAVIKVLKGVLNDCQLPGLTEEEANVLKNKNIINKIASIHPQREGEILITDRINPLTNKKYTDSEVQELKNNNPDKYFSLLSENRISEFRLEIPVEKVKFGSVENHQSEISLTNKNELVKEFSNYKNIVLLLDNSGSMRDNINQLIHELNIQKDDSKNSKIFLGEFSNKLQEVRLIENIKNEKEKIMETIGKGGSKELAVRSVVEAWNQVKINIKPNDKTLVLIMTDEALQGVSSRDLNELLKLPKNVEIKFDFCLDSNQDLEVPLSVIQQEFNIQKDKINKEIELKIKHFTINLQNLEKRLISYHSEIINLQNKSLKVNHYKKEIKEIEKTITELESSQRFYQDRLENLYKDLKNTKGVTLREMKLKDGKMINLNVY